MTKDEKRQVYNKLQDRKLQVAAHTIGIDYPDLQEILRTRDRKKVLHRNSFSGQDKWMDELVEEGKARRGITRSQGAFSSEEFVWYQLTLKGIAWVEDQLQCITFLMTTDFLLVLSKN